MVFEKVKKIIGDKLDALNLLDMGWENRSYDFYLIFGQDAQEEAPWLRSKWDDNFEPYFDRLIKKSPSAKKTGIRIIKYKPEKRFTKKDNQEFTYHTEIKPGRLRWDIQSHEKWTTHNNSETYFSQFELWTPIWTECEKRNSPPDIFIIISNERDFENTRDIQFGYFIVIALARNLEIESKQILKELSEKINAKATILKKRKWGKPEKKGDWTFRNWIQDTFSKGIYKDSDLHAINFDAIDFEPVWEVIYRQKNSTTG